MDIRHLKHHVFARLQDAGFEITPEGTLRLPSADKERVRDIHRRVAQRDIAAHREWLHRHLPTYLPYFANGNEIVPERIDPVVVDVTTQDQRNLFRIARLLWSVPFSRGCGRRLQFLIMDRAHDRLMGILALQSPPLSFPARDRLFHYPPNRKTALVNQTMDIHTLGAVPPYTFLLGGKLIALIAASDEVRHRYRQTYAGRPTTIDHRILPPHLVALTTTSAFGRSSLYHRLIYQKTAIAESIGYTEGYGIFHLLDLYPLFRTVLDHQGISTRGGLDAGPRRKWQLIVRALRIIGCSPEILRHGVQREVFLFRLVENLDAYMEGRDPEPVYRHLPRADLIRWWRERWLLPRAQRVDTWRVWRNENIRTYLLHPPPPDDQ